MTVGVDGYKYKESEMCRKTDNFTLFHVFILYVFICYIFLYFFVLYTIDHVWRYLTFYFLAH